MAERFNIKKGYGCTYGTSKILRNSKAKTKVQEVNDILSGRGSLNVNDVQSETKTDSDTKEVYADVTKDLRKDEFAGLDAYFQKGKLAASNSEASVSQ